MLANPEVKPHAGVELRRALLSIARQSESDLNDLCGDGADRKVHRLRLRMKKLRALLPLVVGLDPTTAAVLRERIRLIKHAVSRQRDQQAMAKLIATLKPKHAGRFKCKESAWPIKPLTNAKRTALRRMLASLISELQHLKLADITRTQITAAHLTTQALVRKQFRDCRKDPSVKHMHRWRKSVKRLYFQSLLLRLPHPQVVLASRLDAILGKLHDRALFKQQHQVSAQLKRTLKDQIKRLRARAFQQAHQLVGAAPLIVQAANDYRSHQ